MKRCLPVLLSKPPESAAQFDAQSDEIGEIHVSKPLKKRRVAVKVACNRCRQKKIQVKARFGGLLADRILTQCSATVNGPNVVLA